MRMKVTIKGEAIEARKTKARRQKGAGTKARKTKERKSISITSIIIFHNTFSPCKFSIMDFMIK